MTDLSVSRAPALAPARTRLPWPALLYAGVGAAGVAGVVAGRMAGGGSGGMEWQLTLLLRFMAVVKGAMVLGALGLTQWRLRRPASDALATGYVVALAAMAVAPGLIWSLAEIVPGAACFHAGFILYLVLAWRDGAVRLPQSSTSTRRA